MISILANNVISPLGMTTQENYLALKAGQSALRRYEDALGIPEPFAASLFTESQWQRIAIPGLTRFEALAVASIREALAQTNIDPSDPKVIFILSTTKANVELLMQGAEPSATYPSVAALHIAKYLGINTKPIVVCNACISGVAAIILADRLLSQGLYDYAIVCGAEVQNTFTVSGFQSLKAVSEQPCRPFDMERTGLNLGEAAATMIVSRSINTAQDWCIECGAIRNDAFHISSPSKNSDGARMALQTIGANAVSEELAFINAHGTATMFNDQMESVAIVQTGLKTVPVNALKGYYGHTLGAAGVIETILSMAAADDGLVLGSRGFEELGVSGTINISAEHRETNKTRFIKMISGFGGGNAAILCVKSPSPFHQGGGGSAMTVSHQVQLTPQSLIIDGMEMERDCRLTELYKRYVGNYPKYFKMDGLARLGFLASELLLRAEGKQASEGLADDRAVILFNHSSSVDADLKFQNTIADPANFFPSPSIFVYTLPNIVTGEIAIRNNYHGETSFYVLEEHDEQLMHQIVAASWQDPGTQSILTGWLDYENENQFIAELFIIERISTHAD